MPSCVLSSTDHGPLAAARRLSSEGALAAAMPCFDRALAILPDPAVHFEHAAAAFRLGNQEQLQRSLRASVRLAPSFADGYFELGNALYSESRHPEAANAFRAALRLPRLGDRAMAHNNLGNAYSVQGDQTSAIEEYQRGLRVAPAFPYLLNGLANSLSSTGREQEAVFTLSRTVAIRPDAHYAQYNLGNYLRGLKRFDEARVYLRAAVAADPSDPRYVTGMGQLYHSTSRLPEAIDAYRTARSLLSAAGSRDVALDVDLAGALQSARRPAEAVRFALAALELRPSSSDGLGVLASSYRDLGRHDEAAEAQLAEATAEVAERGRDAPAPTRQRVALALDSFESQRGGRPRLAIYCRRSYSGEGAGSASSNSWGPRAKQSGIGGSESAVISMSRELSRLGWAVTVFAHPPSEDIGADDAGALWVPHWAYGRAAAREAFDVFVAWRFAEALAVGATARVRYLWLHDEVREDTISPAATSFLEPNASAGTRAGGIFVLSAFHRSQLPPHAARFAVLTSNGLDDAAIADGGNIADRFIYASTPSAGLQPLLQMWPALRRELPNASLHVYYGFWPYSMWSEQPHLVSLRRQLEPLLEQPGVVYHGMRSEEELSHAYAEAGFYAYPTDKPETSGIALMKAQACGCVPVTSRQRRSALPETCAGWDLGPEPRDGFIADDSAWLDDFLVSLVAAARRTDMQPLRERMKASARRRFRWASVARQWDQLFRDGSPPDEAGAAATRATSREEERGEARADTELPTAANDRRGEAESRPPGSDLSMASMVFLEVGLSSAAADPRKVASPPAESTVRNHSLPRLVALQRRLDAQDAARAELARSVRRLEEDVARLADGESDRLH